ncbi:hypothetical protein HOY80DRAFT_1015787 [Tuber brumale]|nr:hypothetical protein HOY80DRAFT_1015787 [Tuber brumale]
MDESAQFFYLKSLPLYEIEKPYHDFTDGASNIKTEKRPLQSVLDIRGREREFTLALHGFEYRTRALPVVNWKDEEEIKRTYVEDLKVFVHELVPETVQRCEMFDFRLRSVEAIQSKIPIHPGLCGTYKLSPAQLVHVGEFLLMPAKWGGEDQTPEGVLEWLKRELGQEETAEIVKNYRVRVINIWRPLVDVVTDNPLAMCDARTVKVADLVGSVHVSSDYTRRNYIVKYSPDFQFYYLSKMTKEEICAFMVFDSCGVGEERIRTPPHSAFWHSEKWRSDECSRESIEVRMLVLSAL